jgi:hypothetical protein
MLSPHQVQQYKEQGFCVALNFLNETAVQALRAEIDAISAGASVANHYRARLEMEPDQGPEGTQVRRIYEPCDRKRLIVRIF